mmetsp:Transcript_20979/g.62062  ORF Transcript_20979/g.62062 Transcript_20979/m.62062 type:complete len:96 (+) Transcript_20979:140-427(+)
MRVEMAVSVPVAAMAVPMAMAVIVVVARRLLVLAYGVDGREVDWEDLAILQPLVLHTHVTLEKRVAEIAVPKHGDALLPASAQYPRTLIDPRLKD